MMGVEMRARAAGAQGETVNPYLRTETAPAAVMDPLEVDELLGTATAARGPANPAAQAPAERPGALPRSEVTSAPTLCVAGAHGGAGASTVARLLGPGVHDAGVTWPVAGGWSRPLPVLPVVLVARTHGAGLAAAERVAQSWAAGELSLSRLLGVVLVDDAPRLTKAQKQAARRVSLMTPFGWHIAWQPLWREVEVVSTDSLTLRVRRTLEHIRRQAAVEPPAVPTNH